MRYILRIELTEEAFERLKRVERIFDENGLRMVPKMVPEMVWFIKWFKNNRHMVSLVQE